ncbi:MAG: hypothetical protein IT445_18990 [Phycisphaeraceae bacterium]|nr:hypothetical protein [Phycisphaeraceae bacterium]
MKLSAALALVLAVCFLQSIPAAAQLQVRETFDCPCHVLSNLTVKPHGTHPLFTRWSDVRVLPWTDPNTAQVIVMEPFDRMARRRTIHSPIDPSTISDLDDYNTKLPLYDAGQSLRTVR